MSPENKFGTEQQQEDQPWKYLGYRAFSLWAGSSEEALILRRFNVLHSRVLLFMQDEIVRMENELEWLDADTVKDGQSIDNGTFRKDEVARRNELLYDLSFKLKRYGKSDQS